MTCYPGKSSHSRWLPDGYQWCQFSIIGLGIWSIIERDSVEAVMMYTLATLISIILGKPFHLYSFDESFSRYHFRGHLIQRINRKFSLQAFSSRSHHSHFGQTCTGQCIFYGVALKIYIDPGPVPNLQGSRRRVWIQHWPRFTRFKRIWKHRRWARFFHVKYLQGKNCFSTPFLPFLAHDATTEQTSAAVSIINLTSSNVRFHSSLTVLQKICFRIKS